MGKQDNNDDVCARFQVAQSLLETLIGLYGTGRNFGFLIRAALISTFYA